MDGPAHHLLTWEQQPSKVLVIKKADDPTMFESFLELIKWLIFKKNLTVFLEREVFQEAFLAEDPTFDRMKDKLMAFNEGSEDLVDKVDFVVCLGNDDTYLHAATKFQNEAPPFIAFHMEMFGLLAPFHFKDFKKSITEVLEGNAPLTFRHRLNCLLVDEAGNRRDCLVLNQVAIKKNLDSYPSNVDFYVNGALIATIEGDGLIFLTPSGNTQYAAAAGTAWFQPSVETIMVAPLTPIPLSFKPVYLSFREELMATISPNSAGPLFVTFDGEGCQELNHGTFLIVNKSEFSLRSVCAVSETGDWVDALTRCLYMNNGQQEEEDMSSDSSSSPPESQSPAPSEEEGL